MFGGGHYDETGHWVQLKHCFIYCGPQRCDCQPPMGIHYDPMRDQRIPKPVQEVKKETK